MINVKINVVVMRGEADSNSFLAHLAQIGTGDSWGIYRIEEDPWSPGERRESKTLADCIRWAEQRAVERYSDAEEVAFLGREASRSAPKDEDLNFATREADFLLSLGQGHETYIQTRTPTVPLEQGDKNAVITRWAEAINKASRQGG